MSKIKIISLPNNGRHPVSLTLSGSDTLFVESNAQTMSLKYSGSDYLLLETQLQDIVPEGQSERLLAAALDYLFSRSVTLAQIRLSPELVTPSNQSLIHDVDLNSHQGICFRSGFYQQKTLWHRQPDAETTPEIWVENSSGVAHPLRQKQPEGLLYQRYDYQSDLTISFRTLDIDTDLDLFHQWMNQPRVAEFWEMAQSREALAEYLIQLKRDRKSWPVIASFNGTPFGYMEVYWAMEDRIAPYYDCQPWDRGFHVLVGEKAFLGPGFSQCWTRSMSHFLFLDEPRTSQLVGEPRADNRRLMKLLQPAGWRWIKEFDFPHKRAALVSCQRRSFFQDIRL